MSSVIEITDAQFETEVSNTDKPVLVYFWASWCGPCRLVSPSITWVAETYGTRLKVLKLEVDPNPDAVAKCQVEGVPAIRLFKDNKLIDSYSCEGAMTKQQIQTLLDNYLNK